MKTCPVCHAVAFDDATTCFGCMHRFDPDPYDSEPLIPSSRDSPFVGHALEGDCDFGSLTVTVDEPLAFLVSIIPARMGEMVAWTCSVEKAAI